MVTNGKSTEATNLPSPAHGREPALSGRLGLGEDTKGAEGEGLRSSLDRLLSDSSLALEGAKIVEVFDRQFAVCL